jgi:hypothetical protein
MILIERTREDFLIILDLIDMMVSIKQIVYEVFFVLLKTTQHLILHKRNFCFLKVRYLNFEF